MKGKRSRKVGALLMLMIVTISLICPVYAYADNKYAKNASDWLRSGIEVIVLVVVAVYAVKHLAKRQFAQFAGFAVLAAFVLAIVYDPTLLKTVGNYIWGIIFN